MVEMELLGVQLEMPSNSPLLLLRESEGARRVLPVYIDSPEARAIRIGIDRVKTARPLTHDLVAALLDELGATVRRVMVTELRDKTFYAEIELAVGESVHVVSARPSDAVALAVRTDTPIFASEDVLDAAGRFWVGDDEDVSEEDSAELIDEFKQFLEDVSPDDFES